MRVRRLLGVGTILFALSSYVAWRTRSPNGLLLDTRHRATGLTEGAALESPTRKALQFSDKSYEGNELRHNVDDFYVQSQSSISSSHSVMHSVRVPPPPPKNCVNTVQGRFLLADDQGFVCPVLSINTTTGCCPPRVHVHTPNQAVLSTASTSAGMLHREGKRHWRFSPRKRYGCHSCNMTSHCCSVYERCVACCQHPRRTPAVLATLTLSAAQESAQPFTSVFEFCRSRCRHNSKSVVHENAYSSAFHHCFSANLLEKTTAAPAERRGAGGERNANGHVRRALDALAVQELQAVAGAAGEDCHSACERSSLRCQETKLQAVNSCELLHHVLGCPGGCFSSLRRDAPGQVAAGRKWSPESRSLCLVNAKPSWYTCDARNERIKRLCVCSPDLAREGA